LPITALPEVMVGVDDRQLGIEDCFLWLLGEPGVVRRRYGSPELGGFLGQSDAPPGAARHRTNAAMIPLGGGPVN
jgi:hypothetical protein